MPLVATAFLAVAPVPTHPLRSTPHPLPFGASSAAGLLCAPRWVQNPNIKRARKFFRIQPPDHVVQLRARRDRTTKPPEAALAVATDTVGGIRAKEKANKLRCL